MTITKAIAAVVLIVSLVGCANSIVQNTQANATLQRDILNLLTLRSGLSENGATVKVASVTKLPQEGKFIVEKWVLESQKGKKAYKVQMFNSSLGGTVFTTSEYPE